MADTHVVDLFPESLDDIKALGALAGACRYVWNRFLGLSRDRQEYHRLSKVVGDGSVPEPDVSEEALCSEFDALRSQGQLDRIRRHDPEILKYTLKLLADSWKRKRAKGQYPALRGKEFKPAFTIPDDVEITGDCLHVPGIGHIPMKAGEKDLAGHPLRVTVRQYDGQQWKASFVMESSAAVLSPRTRLNKPMMQESSAYI